jgi:HEAT repeat protein
LGKIGDVCAVPVLIEELKDENETVRWTAAEALGKMGDTGAVPALIEALQDNHDVRVRAAGALGLIGDASAIPHLIEALQDERYFVRVAAADGLRKIGDSDTLPRKILADPRWSAQERINVVERLRSVRYNEHHINLRYTFPEIRALCQAVLDEEDSEAREGAQAVLDWLNGDR